MNKLIFLAILALGACTSAPVATVNNKKREQVLQREGFTLSAYRNNGVDADSTGEASFNVMLKLDKAFLDNHPDLTKELQYEVDSAFYAVVRKDTVWPLYVLPVANGQPLQPQFIVAFDSKPLQEVSVIEIQTALKALDQFAKSGLPVEMSINK